MTEQYDSLNEKARQIDQCLKYTGGDLGKAKAMVAGQYQDVSVIKGRFHIPEIGQSGMFLVFVNIFDEYISALQTLVVQSVSLFTKTRIFDDWKTLYGDWKNSSAGTSDSSFEESLMGGLISSDVFPEVQDRNIDDLTRKMNGIISGIFEGKTAQVQVELDSTTSLAMELAGVRIDLPGDSGDDRGKPVEKSSIDESMELIEKEARYVVEGRNLIAPVNGKDINEVVPGDRIMVLLSKNNAVSLKILTILEALDNDGNEMPIKGRVRAKLSLGKDGFVLYALVAKGVLAKIIEEEKNVKIRLAVDGETAKAGKKNDGNLIILMSIIVGIIILASVVLFQLL
jgi:hypothetical protein